MSAEQLLKKAQAQLDLAGLEVTLSGEDAISDVQTTLLELGGLLRERRAQLSALQAKYARSLGRSTERMEAAGDAPVRAYYAALAERDRKLCEELAALEGAE